MDQIFSFEKYYDLAICNRLSQTQIEEMLFYIVEHDSMEACAVLGKHYSENNNKKLHYAFFGRAARIALKLEKENSSNPNICHVLGNCYCGGMGVPVDIKRGIEYFDKGSTRYAYHNSGYHRLNGFGIPKDIKKAFEYYHMGAKMGHMSCCHMLGSYYYSGDYGPKDDDKKLYYLTMAAEKRYPNSQNDLAAFYEQLIDQGKITNNVDYYKNQIVALILDAANTGLVCAEHNYGFYAYTGKYIEKNLELAKTWLLKSANKGFVSSQHLLGEIYQKSNTEEAILWLQKAISQDHLESSLLLNQIYYNKKEYTNIINYNVSVDSKLKDYYHLYLTYLELDKINIAMENLMQGASEGRINCIYILGLCYLAGENVDKNTDKGLEYLESLKTDVEAMSILSYLYYGLSVTHKKIYKIGPIPKNMTKVIPNINGSIKKQDIKDLVNNNEDLKSALVAYQWPASSSKITYEKFQLLLEISCCLSFLLYPDDILFKMETSMIPILDGKDITDF